MRYGMVLYISTLSQSAHRKKKNEEAIISRVQKESIGESLTILFRLNVISKTN